jgi:hypothetical protein
VGQDQAAIFPTRQKYQMISLEPVILTTKDKAERFDWRILINGSCQQMDIEGGHVRRLMIKTKLIHWIGSS